MDSDHQFKFPLFLFLLTLLITSVCSQSCTRGCDLALASFFISDGTNLTGIRDLMQSRILDPVLVGPIMSFNRQLANGDLIQTNTRVNVPFPCDCLSGGFLGHVFRYNLAVNDTYAGIAAKYANLTTEEALERFNAYNSSRLPDSGVVNVTVNCSCGNADVSRDFGLFVTYPLRPEDNFGSVAAWSNVSSELVRRYNEGVDFGRGSGLVYIPMRDADGSYRPLGSRKAINGLRLGIAVAAGVVIVMLLAGFAAARVYRRKSSRHRRTEAARARKSPLPSRGVTVGKSVEFTYEELAAATDDFSLSKKIGEGGFGEVYYAELRGQKTAIKKMKMEASKEFLAELKVLTNVHHLTLVRLIGYCIKGSLFLVYEYVENGNLSQHLRGSDREPLSWSSRLQIALDSARGLEYIHEHTIPVYIHRDIKSANILIDNNLRAKVADFGLAKLAKIEGTLVPSQVLVGTFGYMPPEYIHMKAVSSKVDVYAFGVILYELISGKEAIISPNGSSQIEATTLVALFGEVLKNQPCSEQELMNLIDPSLGHEYPLDSVRKMAELGRACTRENPEVRPSMRSVVIALTAISSVSEAWNPDTFYRRGNSLSVDFHVNKNNHHNSMA